MDNLKILQQHAPDFLAKAFLTIPLLANSKVAIHGPLKSLIR